MAAQRAGDAAAVGLQARILRSTPELGVGAIRRLFLRAFLKSPGGPWEPFSLQDCWLTIRTIVLILLHRMNALPLTSLHALPSAPSAPSAATDRDRSIFASVARHCPYIQAQRPFPRQMRQIFRHFSPAAPLAPRPAKKAIFRTGFSGTTLTYRPTSGRGLETQP